MATYKITDTETWLPRFARGKGARVVRVRLHTKSGETIVVTPDAQGRISTTDERTIRHMGADPRFELVTP